MNSQSIQNLLEDLRQIAIKLDNGPIKDNLLKQINNSIDDDSLLNDNSSKNDPTTTDKQDKERKKLINIAKEGVKGKFYYNLARILGATYSEAQKFSEKRDKRYDEEEAAAAKEELKLREQTKNALNNALKPDKSSSDSNNTNLAKVDPGFKPSSSRFIKPSSSSAFIASMTEQIKDVIKISKEIEKKLNNDSVLRKSDMEKLLNEFSKLTEPKDKSKDNTSSAFTAEQDEQQETLKKALTQALEKIISENPTLLQCSGGGLFNPFGRNPSRVPAPKPSSPTAIKPVPTNLQVDKNGKPLTGINLERREAKLAKIAANVTPVAAAGSLGSKTKNLIKPISAGATKIASKALIKSAIKKIPLIGLVAGLAFAGQRAVSGDFTGAALELGSGIAGTLPGLGTATSVGLDATLAAKDAGILNMGGETEIKAPIAGSMGGGAIADKGIEMSRNNTPAATEIKAPDLIARNSVPGGVNIVKGNIDTKNQLVEQKKIIKNIEKSTDPKKQKPNVINNITNVSQKMPEKIKTGNEENTFNRLIAQDFEHPSMHSNFNMG